ncbi:hypothetical protein EI42_04392 [Thermosporothrix hazakensis]|jgi:hypothetical protein|uniref:Uncharacterized protein n=1 Tax=Thermosporothrix hazakensis TaxID=644383 RepID=A0A326U2S2_THEHA|nr:hypothetical protein [Thermosporothrix hazakensis]PZW25340.1 hypothetical protein EI42_04392 [Thermosporothrix hazakensis]GCE50570.1 hypothetical protein KTH_54390 [Thermosporothrix hazakensis]
MTSDIVHLRREIEATYSAATLGLTGLAAGESTHQAKAERLGLLLGQVQALVGEQQGLAIYNQTLSRIPDIPCRSSILSTLPTECGDTEEIAILCDWLRDMWETMDLRRKRFGEETAQKIIAAPPVQIGCLLYTQERKPRRAEDGKPYNSS